MIATLDLVDSYLMRLRDLALNANHIERYYLFMTDERLYYWENALSNSEHSAVFYGRLLDQYRSWRETMGADRWAEVTAYNDSLNGANRNWMLEELD